MRVKLVEYGNGNTASIVNAFARIGASCIVVRSAKEIAGPEPLVLGGVGRFDDAMKRLTDSGMKDALLEAVGVAHMPVLGICLGLQLLTRSSEEGTVEGLGLLPAHTVRFDRKQTSLPVPHIGWTEVVAAAGPDILPHSTAQEYYFNHAYHLTRSAGMQAAMCSYGYSFPAAVQLGHIYGVQFHPEKSRAAGEALLARFAALSIKQSA